MLQDDYVEVVEVKSAAPVRSQHRIVARVVEPVDTDFIKRMDNWRKAIRGSGGGCSAEYCAGWARLYVEGRMAREDALGVFVGLQPISGATRISVDELDGWLVESAMRRLADFNERKALQYRFVWQYSDHWIKTKLKLRGNELRLVLGRAQTNLKIILRKLDSAATILSNNSHAGVDPRPESIDAPVGGVRL